MLTSQAGEFRAFGYEAEQRYTEYKNEIGRDNSEEILLFRNFKMKLMKAEVRFSQATHVHIHVYNVEDTW